MRRPKLEVWEAHDVIRIQTGFACFLNASWRGSQCGLEGRRRKLERRLHGLDPVRLLLDSNAYQALTLASGMFAVLGQSLIAQRRFHYWGHWQGVQHCKFSAPFLGSQLAAIFMVYVCVGQPTCGYYFLGNYCSD